MRFESEWEENVPWDTGDSAWNERIRTAQANVNIRLAADKDARLQLLRLALANPEMALEKLTEDAPSSKDEPPSAREKLTVTTPWPTLIRAAERVSSWEFRHAEQDNSLLSASLDKATWQIRQATGLPDRVVRAELGQQLKTNRVARGSAVSTVRFYRDEAAQAPRGWTQCSACDADIDYPADTCQECGETRRS